MCESSTEHYYYRECCLMGKYWDVQLDFVPQFKSELVRQLVFEKKSIFLRLG